MESFLYKSLIHNLKKSKLHTSNKIGGNLQDSYTEYKIEPDVKTDTPRIPDRFYFTSTPYPISIVDSMANLGTVAGSFSGRFSSDLHVPLGDNDSNATYSFISLSGLFKVSLKVYEMLPATESISTSFVSITGVLRNVLRGYTPPTMLPVYAGSTLRPTFQSISGILRSVLIVYSYYATESISFGLQGITTTGSISLESTYKSFMNFNSTGSGGSSTTAQPIVDVTERTWTIGTGVSASTTTMEGFKSRYFSGVSSTMTTEHQPEFNLNTAKDVVVEGWFKPDSCTTTLLTTFGGADTESAILTDFSGNTTWSYSLVTKDSNSLYFAYDGTQSFATTGNTTAMTLPMTSTGWTIDFHCAFNNGLQGFSERKVLVGNMSSTWNPSSTGKSLGIVLFGTGYPNSALRGKIALISDNTSITTDPDGVIVVLASQISNVASTVYNISFVGKNNVITMFLNGVIQSTKTVSQTIDLSYLGTGINYIPWDTASNSVLYIGFHLLCLRVSNVALYTTAYTPAPSSTLKLVPRVSSMGNPITLFNKVSGSNYQTGFYCELSYTPTTELVTVTAGYGVSGGTVVASGIIDITNWNNIKAVYSYDGLALYVNSKLIQVTKSAAAPASNTSVLSIGYDSYNANIKNYSGYIDNLAVRSEAVKQADCSNGALTSVLNFDNSLIDYNPNVIWTTVGGVTLGAGYAETGANGVLFNTGGYITSPYVSNRYGDNSDFEVGCSVSNITSKGNYGFSIFNNTTNITDDTVPGNSWSQLSGTVTASGVYAAFNGSSSLVAPNNPHFNLGTVNGINITINCTAISNGQVEVLYSNLDTNNFGISAGITGTSSSTYTFWVKFYGNDLLRTLTTPGTYNTNTLINFKHVLTPMSSAIYVNNVFVIDVKPAGAPTTYWTYANSTGVFKVGCSTTDTQYFTGQVQLLSMWGQQSSSVLITNYATDSSGFMLSLVHPFEKYSLTLSDLITPITYSEVYGTALIDNSVYSRVSLRTSGNTLDISNTNPTLIGSLNSAGDNHYYGWMDNVYVRTYKYPYYSYTVKKVDTVFDSTILNNTILFLRASNYPTANYSWDESRYMHGINTTGSGFANARFDKGLRVISGNYAQVNDSILFRLNTDDFLIEFDVKSNVTSRPQVIMDRIVLNSVGTWEIIITTAGRLEIIIADTTSSLVSLTATNGVLNDGSWHKVQIMRKGNKLYYYIDERVSDSFLNFTYNLAGASTYLGIGAQINTRDSSKDFQGYLDNIRISRGNSGAISIAEPKLVRNVTPETKALLHFEGPDNSTVFTDELGGTWSAVSNTPTISTAQCRSGSSSLYLSYAASLRCSASSNYDLKGVDFTIQVSVRVVSHIGAENALIARDSYASTTPNYYLSIGAGLNCVNFTVFDSGGAYVVYSAYHKLELNTWYDLEVAGFNGAYYCFLNGQRLPSYKSTGAILDNTLPTGTAWNNSSHGLLVGQLGDIWNARYTNAYIDELRVIKGKALHTANFNTYGKYLTTYLPMDSINGQTSIADSGNIDKLWTTNGNAVLSTAQPGVGISSLYLNGSGSYISTPSDPSFNLGTKDFTLIVSFYNTDNATTYQSMWTNGLTSYGDGAVNLTLRGSTHPTKARKVSFDVGVSGSTVSLWSNSTFAINTWYTIKVTRKGSFTKLYVNNALDAVGTLTAAVDLGLSGVIIGKDGWSSYCFTGYLRDIYLYTDIAIDTPTVQDTSVLAGMSFEDGSTTTTVTTFPLVLDRLDSYYNDWYTYVNSLGNTPILKTIGTSGEAIYFDGNSNIYSFNEHSRVGLSPFTIEFYCQPTTGITASSAIVSGYPWIEVGINSNNSLYFGSNSSTSQVTAANAVLSGVFTHVAITRDASYNLRIFINGVNSYQTVDTTSYSYTVPTSSYPLRLGQWGGNIGNASSNHFTGYIENFYMSRGECKYTSNFTPAMDSTIKRTPVSLLNFSPAGSAATYTDTYNSIVWTNTGGVVNNNKVLFRPLSMQFTNPSYGLVSSVDNNFQLLNNDFTLDLIFCPTQIVAETSLLDMRGSGNCGIYITQPAGNAASLSIFLGTSLTTPWDISYNSGTNSLTSGTIYHIRICRNMGSIYIFLNGALVNTTGYLGQITTPNKAYLANNYTYTKGFGGYIEQFRLIQNGAESIVAFPPINRELA